MADTIGTMKLTEWLSKHGLSKTTLAKKLKVSRQAVDKWTKGQMVPRRKKIERLTIITKGEVSAGDFYP